MTYQLLMFVAGLAEERVEDLRLRSKADPSSVSQAYYEAVKAAADACRNLAAFL